MADSVTEILTLLGRISEDQKQFHEKTHRGLRHIIKQQDAILKALGANPKPSRRSFPTPKWIWEEYLEPLGKIWIWAKPILSVVAWGPAAWLIQYAMKDGNLQDLLHKLAGFF